MESKLRHAFASIVLINEKAGYSPQPFVFRQRFDFLVVAASVDSWKLISGAILAPPNRLFTRINQYRVRSAMSNKALLVLPVHLFLFVERQPSPNGLWSLIEHTPTTSLL